MPLGGLFASFQIPPEDTASTRSSFTVQDLRPFTEYVFRVRSMKEDGRGFWSAWSEEARGSTAEDSEWGGAARGCGCCPARDADLAASSVTCCPDGCFTPSSRALRCKVQCALLTASGT